MNSNVDLTQFLPGANAPQPARSSTQSPDSLPDTTTAAARLVAPPRRIVSRLVVPALLLAGFVAVAGYTLRGAMIPVVDVTVTMPVPATDALLSGLSVPVSQDNSALTTTSAVQSKTSPKKTATTAGGETPRRAFTKTALFQAPGWVEPSPFPIIIPALRAGTVETVHVLEGQQITSGSVVAKLVDDDARLALQLAQSTLALKQSKYDAALSNWKNPIALTESVATAQARGEQLSAQAQRLRDVAALAGVEARIGKTLSQGGYEASLDAQRTSTQLSARRHELLETHAEISLNSATLKAATDRLRLRIDDREAVETARAELQEAKVAVATAQLAMDRSIIRTPVSGTIMRLAVSPGSMVSGEMENGMTIAQLYQPEKLQVRVDVPLAEAAKVRPGLPAEIKAEALPGKVFQGRLVNIVPQFDLQKNVLPVKVFIDNPDPALRPEMITRVEFFAEQEIVPETEESSPGADQPVAPTPPGIAKTDKPVATPSSRPPVEMAASNMLVIPASVAARSGESISRVTVAAPDGTAQTRQISATPHSNNLLLVSSGLRLTDKIITTPAKVAAGTKVRIKKVVSDVSH